MFVNISYFNGYSSAMIFVELFIDRTLNRRRHLLRSFPIYTVKLFGSLAVTFCLTYRKPNDVLSRKFDEQVKGIYELRVDTISAS